MKTIVLSPAYGRDYKSKKAVEEDFKTDKDFVIRNITDPYCGKPCNRSQLLETDYTHAEIRYSRLMKLTIVPLR